MGSQQSIQKCNFEDVQCVIKSHNKEILLINTLSESEQDCLIQGTICYRDEVQIINTALTSKQPIKILVYGKNSNDTKVIEKYRQLCELGFVEVYIYYGGMFEWLCLQDIFGEDEFPTTKKELDILRYKPTSNCSQLLLTNS